MVANMGVSSRVYAVELKPTQVPLPPEPEQRDFPVLPLLLELALARLRPARRSHYRRGLACRAPRESGEYRVGCCDCDVRQCAQQAQAYRNIAPGIQAYLLEC